MLKKYFLILIFIILLGGVLRFYNLANLPPSLEWDEVATGYDANSILKTGRDQYGHFLPLTFRSLDDYKPPLYTYMTAVSIAVWGWNDFAIRFPAAFLGTLAILTTYGLIAELFGNKKLALLTALLLAISPWHVNFSRLALETNSTIFMTTAAVWAFLAGVKKGWWLALSAFLFGLDLFLYHNARVFVPLLAVVLLILYFRELTAQKKYVVLAAVISIFFIIKLIPIATSIEGKMRFEGTSIFTPAAPIDTTESKQFYTRARLIDNQNGLSLYGTLFHNEYVMWGLLIFKNYLSHFSPDFLVFTNDYPRHHVPEMGLIYFIELPLLIVGLYYVGKYPGRRAKIIAFAWLLIAPLPAAVTRDVPHALRSEIMLPMVQLFIALALISIVRKINWKVGRVTLLSFLVILYIINVSFFLHKFLFHYARETSEFWQYGRREAAQYADAHKNEYARVIVSTRLEQPHVFFLYYLKYNPSKYLAEGGTVSGGWAEERNKFDKYEFKPINYGAMSDGSTLFVGLPSEFSRDSVPLVKIKYLNGKDAIWIVKG